MKLAKIEKPKRIVLMTAPEWKWKLFEELKKSGLQEIMSGNALKKAIEKKEFQGLKTELSYLFNQVKNNADRISQHGVVSQKEEWNALNEKKAILEKEFGAKIELDNVVNAKNNLKGKEKNALPLKPAIMVE